MTENRWTPEGSHSAPPAAGQHFDTGGPASRSTTDAVRQEGSVVAHEAAGAAQGVAETAKQEAANVAAEVKYNARELLDQARSDLTEQAGYQQQKVAAGLRSIADELWTMADASEDPGVATDLVRQAAERSSAVASWLEDRDPGSLLDEVKSFARERPGAFLAIAAGAGILAGRLSRGLSAGPMAPARRDAGGAVPPPPVRLPQPDMTPAEARTAGTPTEEPRTAGTPTEEPRTAGTPTEEPRTAGTTTEGMRTVGATGAGALAAAMQAGGTQAAGAEAAGAQGAGTAAPDARPDTTSDAEEAPLDKPAAYRTTGPTGNQAPEGAGEVPPVEEPYSDDQQSGGKHR